MLLDRQYFSNLSARILRNIFLMVEEREMGRKLTEEEVSPFL